MNISDWIKRHALLSPDKVVLRFESDTYTYSEFEAQIEATAYVFKWQLGVGEGERVAFLSHNCPEFLITLLACARIGALFVPLNSRLTVPEHLYILRDAAPKALLLQEAFATLVAPVATALPDCQIVGLDFAPDIRHEASWDGLLSTAQSDEIRKSDTPNVDAQSPVLIVYTSGTTGYPKGAVHTHNTVLWNAIQSMHLNELTGADHILTLSPLFHVGGFNIQTLPAFYCGATVTLHSRFDPDQTLLAISEDKPTLTVLVPSMMGAVIRSPLWDTTDFSSLRTVVTGSTIVPQALCEAFDAQGVQVVDMYGATETGPTAIYKRPGSPKDKSTSVGLPAPHCAVRVVDSDGNDQPAGEAGEILIKGPNVMLGYWKNETATAQALRDGWYHTGDMGYCDEDGYYFISGRKKNLIIKGGQNIYPAEVERLLNAHPEIEESAVVAMPNERWQEIPVAVLVAKENAKLDLSEVRLYLADKLAAYKIPHRFVLTEALPKNALGKIQHFRVREEQIARQGDKTEINAQTKQQEAGNWVAQLDAMSHDERRDGLFSYLQSHLEAQLADRDGIDQIEASQTLIRMGLDSLMAAEIRNDLQKRLDITVPMNLFLANTTLAQLVQYIDEQRWGGRSESDGFAMAAQTEKRESEDGEPVIGNITEKIVETYPLSYGQRGLWFDYKLNRDNTDYNLSTVVRIGSVVDLDVLRTAFQHLLNRHPALRTTFGEKDGEPVQRVHHHQTISFTQVDATPRLGATQAWRGDQWDEETLQTEVMRHHQIVFDIEQGPLFRVVLFTRRPDEHLLLLSWHHLVTDGASIARMIAELPALYLAAQRKTTPDLPLIQPTYAQYVAWQGRMLAAGKIEAAAARAFWHEQLAGELPLLNLPTDRPHPVVRTAPGAAMTIEIPAPLAQALRFLARQEGVTLYSLLLAAYQVFLHRYTGQDDLVVGSVAAGRSRPEFAEIVGYFASPVAIRAKLRAEMAFDDLLQQTHQTVVDVLTHQDYPFALLVEELQPPRTAGRLPIFQSSFVLQKMNDVEGSRGTVSNFEQMPLIQEVHGLHLSKFVTFQDEAQFDLALELSDLPDGLAGVFKYSPELFDQATIERMAGNFQTLLASLVANPHQHISALPLLTEAERHQLLVEWNDTGMPARFTAIDVASPPELGGIRGGACIHELFSAQAERTPEAIAVVFGEEAISYRALDEQSNRLAHYLRSLGVERETLVGICVERGIEMMVGLLGILKAGGAYVPLDPSFPAERLAYMLEDSQVSVLLSQQHVSQQLRSLASVARVIHLDTLLDQLSQGAEWPLEFDNDSGQLIATPDSLAYTIYTSGSTGKPKGVQIPHRALTNFLASMAQQPGLSSDDVLVAVTTLSFDIAALELYLPLLVGARLVIASREVTADGFRLRSLLSASNATVMQATPATWQLLLATGWQNEEQIKILCGGEALPQVLAEELLAHGSDLWNMYGPTETTIWSTTHPVKQANSLISIGRPIANTQIYILNQGSVQEPVPIGVIGDLYIGGDGLARGYLNRPQLTAEKFVESPYGRLYKTGDLARYLPDGNIEFLGRIDHQVKIRGYRIELGEIEAVLAEDSMVQQAVVVAHTYQAEDKRLIAYVVPTDKSDAEENRAALISTLRQRSQQKLPAYMVPSLFIMLDELPLTPNGKVNRRALPAPTARGKSEEAGIPPFDPSTGSGQRRAPQTELEKLLVTIWCEELGIETVGIHDNFFEVGGHSLLLVKIQTRLQKALNQELTVVDLMRYPTIQTLAQFLTASQRDASQSDEDAVGSISKDSSGALPVERPPRLEEREIAIVGMAARFPGTDSAPRLRGVEAFWQNLCEGKESISRFSDEQLLASGVDAALLSHPDYVKASGVLSGIEQFDASFFGISPREAKTLDPQIRLFMECAWQALEDAGCNPYQYSGKIGLYAGAGLNTYWQNNLSDRLDPTSSVNAYHAMISNDKDFLSTRVSYKLNLKGPSLTVQTACSTSLVATHLACQSLLNGESDMALAGGVSVRVPHEVGYLYQEDMIFSPDGHCRAFDAQAQGTVFGNGLGVVVLKRLSDALADGDVIHAVIKGSAINNDGATKMGYTAPSVEGQIEVITQAMANAKVTPDTITYIEAHGTGTPLGDPIEMAALKEVFGNPKSPQASGKHCAIGAVKTNIGHLDMAAGIAGLIKTTLALKHKQLPPTLHFSEPNPLLDLDNSPFYINTELIPWQTNGVPRRAGVSSFGIGGTNAHLILEEAPQPMPIRREIEPNRHASGPTQASGVAHHLFTLSAKNEKALADLIDRYIDFLASNTEDSLADICFTSHLGRAHFDQRLTVVASSKAELRDTLARVRGGEHVYNISKGQAQQHQRIAFLLTGQGSQYVQMGHQLYQTQPTFRQALERCDEILHPYLDQSLLSILYPSHIEHGLAGKEKKKKIDETAYTQPALFALEYALAQLWMSWGIKPDMVMGHSVGEIVAACIAGVFSLEDGLKLVAARGRLMQALPQEGQMVSVMADESQIQALIAPYTNQVSIAALNGPESVVISGKTDAIQQIVATLGAKGIKSRQLTVSHAFHSPLMAPMLSKFAQLAEQISYSAPKIPFISNVTGQLVTASPEVTTPAYWVRHVREAVRFTDGMATLHEQKCELFIEIGPKPILLGMGRQCLPASYGVWLPSLRPKRDDWSQILHSLGELYVRGVDVDWVGFARDYAKQRRKVVLPTYPFQRERYWVESAKAKLEKQELEMKNEALQMDHKQNARTATDLDTIVQHVQQEVAKALQINPLHLDNDTSLIELGSDSLILTEVGRAIKDTYGVNVGIRQLFEELDTVNRLAMHIHQALPSSSPYNGSAPTQTPVPKAPYDTYASLTTSNGTEAGNEQVSTSSPVPTAPSAKSESAAHLTSGAVNNVGNSALERVMSQQIQAMSQLMSQNTQAMSQLMSQQLEVLSGHRFPAPQPAPAKSQTTSPVTQSGHFDARQAAPEQKNQSTATSDEETSSSAFNMDSLSEPSRSLTPQQQAHLDALIARYTQRTRGSRAQTTRERPILSDIRYLMGWRAEIKEMRYPIIAERSSGARFWDVDGHEYIDLSMGFGVHLLGHNPPSIMQAIQEQLSKGMQLGPQSDVAGEVSELVCELTGAERVSFHNSGTEAVMTAIRLARAATGHTKIALFSGSYHGHSDGTLVTEAYVNGELKSAPMASGIPQYIADDVLVLPYGKPDALEVIQKHAHQLAAVLVEPVPSRKPSLQPKEFLHELRTITCEAGIILIFDEVITGFRVHPAGAQALFGIEADLVTYGKVVGGGMPIGMVAGKAEYLDYIDGGMSQYNEQSPPKNKLTFVAGTFCRHPLAMATSRAMLKHLKEEGPGLQERLNQRTAQLAQTLNRYFEQEQVPIEMTHFGSLFRLAFSKNVSYLYQPLEMDLLYHHLIEKGIYFWEGRTCFLSTAHKADDIATLVSAVKETIAEMKRGGFFPNVARRAGMSASKKKGSSAKLAPSPHPPNPPRPPSSFSPLSYYWETPKAGWGGEGCASSAFWRTERTLEPRPKGRT